MMDRRDLIKTGLTGMMAGLVAPTMASTVLAPDAKMMPVDTRNGRNGWKTPARRVVQIKKCRIGEGSPKIIASTTAKTPESFLKIMKDYAAMPELDAIEMRPDYIGVISGKEFADLSREAYKLAGDKPVLMTFRDKTEGGGRHVSDDWYGQFYDAVLDNGSVDWFDIEQFRDIEVCRHIMKKGKAKGKVMMFSDHEFGWTPSEDEIIRRLLFQEKEGSDILKLAVMAHNTGDALRLMSATWKVRNYYSDRPMLTMAMGRWGVLSRCTGEFTGTDLSFAMVGGIPSAPGQIPYKDLKVVHDVLHNAMYPKGK